MNSSSSLELSEIQGLVLDGQTDKFPCAAYLVFQWQEQAEPKKWLDTLIPDITTADQASTNSFINVAFTYSGMSVFPLPQETIDSFSLEFKEGMSSPHRNRILGDVHSSAPSLWRWGSEQNYVDGIVVIFATNQNVLDQIQTQQIALMEQHGVSVLESIHSYNLPNDKEHFGFRDGIAQPKIVGFDGDNSDNTVHPGEFLLGYLNEYSRYSLSPVVALENDPEGILPMAEEADAHRSLGRNGSYLVFRQLSQNVQGFWQSIESNSNDVEDMVRIASKMVGRWPNGAPLVLSEMVEPSDDHPMFSTPGALDNFGYYDADEYGYKCPMGSHIRRTNPRDALMPDPGSEISIDSVKHHRILRRGRPYGAPVVEDMDPSKIVKAPEDTEERGLLFLCMNANIARQFEFIQHTWINNKKFAGLYNDADPLMGVQDPKNKGETGDFNIPAKPVRDRIQGLERFVEVRGGSYFFIPSKRALTYLKSL